MKVLAIDTCGPAGSITVGSVEDEAVEVLALTELAGKTYSAQLVPAIRLMLENLHIKVETLGAIVVVNGPGSFTGIRVGVSTAKGFAEALGTPTVAVSRLALLAWKAGLERAALDAGRGEFYFRNHTSELLLGAEDIPATEPVSVCEENAVRVFPQAVLVEAPTAGDALRFAASRVREEDFADMAALDGNYVRRSDAEIFAKAGPKCR